MAMMTNEQIARQWGEGLAGDMTRLAGIASPDMRVWHSSDGIWLDRDTAQARMAAAGGDAAPLGFTDIRTMVTERGFLVQATIERDGLQTHIVQLLTVEDGRVAACEEYIADESPPS
jgi:hypothetical protein